MNLECVNDAVLRYILTSYQQGYPQVLGITLKVDLHLNSTPAPLVHSGI